jgi:hypothetical protein
VRSGTLRTLKARQNGKKQDKTGVFVFFPVLSFFILFFICTFAPN